MSTCIYHPTLPVQLDFLSEPLSRAARLSEPGQHDDSGSTTPLSTAPGMSIDEFKILKPISRGAFGRVYLARKLATGDLFAIKVSSYQFNSILWVQHLLLLARWMDGPPFWMAMIVQVVKVKLSRGSSKALIASVTFFDRRLPPYTIKVMKKKDLIRKNMVESVNNERNILALANNPYVVRFYYSFTSKENLYLVM